MVFDLSILINKPEEINGLKFQHVFHSLLLINIIGCFSNPDTGTGIEYNIFQALALPQIDFLFMPHDY